MSDAVGKSAFPGVSQKRPTDYQFLIHCGVIGQALPAGRQLARRAPEIEGWIVTLRLLSRQPLCRRIAVAVAKWICELQSLFWLLVGRQKHVRLERHIDSCPVRRRDSSHYRRLELRCKGTRLAVCSNRCCGFPDSSSASSIVGRSVALVSDKFHYPPCSFRSAADIAAISVSARARAAFFRA